MKGAALEGELKGHELKELPIGEKTTWKAWRTKYPDTKVLSFKGSEDGSNPYENYFKGDKGFRGLKASDARLQTMTPVFAFRYQDRTYAIAYSDLETGLSIPLTESRHLFLYRNKSDDLSRSTSAFISNKGFAKDEQTWTEIDSGKVFDETTRDFEGGLERMSGFDTFWYNCPMNVLLGSPAK